MMDRLLYSPTPLPKHRRPALFAALLLLLASAAHLRAQDIFGEANKALADRTRLAVANFKGNTPGGQADTLRVTFDTVLFNDLSNAGIFDMVSKSMAPPVSPGTPAEINLPQWSGAPVNAAMVAFGIACGEWRQAVSQWISV